MADQALPILLDLIRDLVPLMRHAVEMNRLLLGHCLDAAALRLGAEPDDAAVLLLNAQGLILFANPRAEALVAEGDLLRSDTLGRLRLAHLEGERHLSAALDSRGSRSGSAFRLRTLGLSQEVRLLRLPPEVVERLALRTLMGSQRPSLLVVLRPATSPTDERGRVADRLGLTLAEAAVALAIAEGATLAEVAAERGVSLHTVRNQLKSALSKTGAGRQSDLVRILVMLRQWQ